MLITHLKLRARAYRAAARSQQPGAAATEIYGWLLEAVDGERSGWWGPVERATADLAVSILDRVEVRTPTSPPRWAERMRRALRHSHAGLGAVAIGAAELAAWDLLGHREGAPVWALVGGSEPRRCASYATCLGIAPDSDYARALARRLGEQSGPIQKWDAAADPAALERLADTAGGADRMAVDMKGRFELEAAKRYCALLPRGMAWIEEPLPPWRIHDSPKLDLASPLAAGEHMYGPAEIAGLRSAGVSIFQPDAVFCGGFAVLQEITELLLRPREQLAAHGGGLLPALHLAAAGTPVDLVEWHLGLEPRRLAHLASPPEPDEEFWITAPSAPGWAGPLAAEVRLC